MLEKMATIAENGTVYKTEKGTTFDNAVRRLIQLAEKFPKGVRFEHVYAGSEDEGIQAVSFRTVGANTDIQKGP